MYNNPVDKTTEALKSNTVLTSLDLSNNPLSFIDKNLLVKQNLTLLELNLNETNILVFLQSQLKTNLEKNKTNIQQTAEFIHAENRFNKGRGIDITKRPKFFLYESIRHIFCNHILSGTLKFCEVFGTREIITRKQCQFIDYMIERNWLQLGGICKRVNEGSEFSKLSVDMVQQIGRHLKLSDIKHKKNNIGETINL